MPPDPAVDAPAAEAVGPNAWLVDEMYEQYRADPAAVSESWREFFADYQSDTEAGANTGPDVSQPATGRKGGGEPAGNGATAPTDETAPSKAVAAAATPKDETAAKPKPD